MIEFLRGMFMNRDEGEVVLDHLPLNLELTVRQVKALEKARRVAAQRHGKPFYCQTKVEKK